MTESKPKLADVPILNPRYAGATPEMVGLALLRHKPKAEDGEVEEASPVIDDPAHQSSI